MFKQDFTCPALLEDCKRNLPIRGYHPLWLTFPSYSGFSLNSHWPGPLSLVTTNGVSVDVLSSSYLDISVHWVCLPCGINLLVWVSPFGNPRIKAYSQLPMAYRSVSRPSSPLCAKASTKCSYRHLIGPYMKAEIGQTDQIFQLGYYKYPVQSKEIIKFNLIFEVSHTLSNRLVKSLSRIVYGGRCWT